VLLFYKCMLSSYGSDEDMWCTVQVVVSLAAGMPREVAPTADDEDKTHSTPSSVEDVAFFPSLPLALTASLSGAVGVWDIATQKLRHTLQHQVDLIPCIVCTTCDTYMFCGAYDHVVWYIFTYVHVCFCRTTSQPSV
jgi:hypothetical protein